MIVKCSWCQRIVGVREPLKDTRVTHTICRKCSIEHFGIDIGDENDDGEDDMSNPRVRPSRATYCPERIVDPKKFDRRSFRTKAYRAHRLTFGCPKGKWDAKRGICKVPVQLQRILHPAGEGKCPVPGKELKNPGVKWHEERHKKYGKMATEAGIKGRNDLRQLYRGYSFAHGDSVVASEMLGLKNPFKKVSEIKARHKGYWFAPKTMKFFKSKVYPTVYGGKYFISSEQSPFGPRRFTIREYDEVNDDINTVGEMGKYRSLEEAREAVKDLVKGKHNPHKCPCPMHKNPGAEWHKGQRNIARIKRRDSIRPEDRNFWDGHYTAHQESYLESEKRMLMNPTPAKIYSKAIELYVKGWGADSVKEELQKLYKISSAKAEAVTRRAASVISGKRKYITSAEATALKKVM
jgi:rRNA processing protein Krr1/Pno1